MDFDLITLRMAIVCDDAAQCEVLRRAAGMASMPIDVAVFSREQRAGAHDKLASGEADIVFIDAGLPSAECHALVHAARLVKKHTLVILIGVPNGSAREGSADGVDAILETPVDILKASAVMERCVRAWLPNRVLVVDDSATVRSIVRKIMRASRFRLETEETDEGEAALELVRSGRFDIVFLDCNMPGLDGFATLTEIKRNHPRVDTVMMTGTRDQAIAERARGAGAKGFLFKPFFPQDIDAVLHGLFGLSVPETARA